MLVYLELWGQLARLTCKKPRRVCNFWISKYFLFGQRFLHDWSIVFLSSFENILEPFDATEYDKTQARFLIALVPEKVLNKPKTKFALTCSFRKVVRTFAVRKREKFENSTFLPKIGTD